VFDDMFAEVVAPAFARREPRLRARAYLLGLVSGLERKNGWTLAELAGDATPDGMQRLLNAACWDADGVRDGLGRYVAAQLGDPAAVLVADDTGFEKSGLCSAGVQRQYTGAAGKITNCQIGVFLAYAVPGGARALIDRDLYVPRSWTADRERCASAGIPEDTRFATKPQLAQAMIERAVAAGIPFAWFTADEVYGDNGPHMAGRDGDLLCAGGLLRPSRARRRGPEDPGGQAGRQDPAVWVATGLVRAGVQG
jgi:SRSO17 transposase